MADPITPSAPAAAPAAPAEEPFNSNLTWERVEHSPTSAVQPRAEPVATAAAPEGPQQATTRSQGRPDASGAARSSARALIDLKRERLALAEKRQRLEQDEERLLPEAEMTKRFMARHDRDVLDYVQSNPDKFELIHVFGVQNKVTELMQQVHQRFNTLITKEDAAREYEKFLGESLKRASRTKTFKSLVPSPEPNRRPYSGRASSSYGRSTDEDERFRRARDLLKGGK